MPTSSLFVRCAVWETASLLPVRPLSRILSGYTPFIAVGFYPTITVSSIVPAHYAGFAIFSFLSFSIHFRDHPAIILNVTDGCFYKSTIKRLVASPFHHLYHCILCGQGIVLFYNFSSYGDNVVLSGTIAFFVLCPVLAISMSEISPPGFQDSDIP